MPELIGITYNRAYAVNRYCRVHQFVFSIGPGVSSMVTQQVSFVVEDRTNTQELSSKLRELAHRIDHGESNFDPTEQLETWR